LQGKKIFLNIFFDRECGKYIETVVLSTIEKTFSKVIVNSHILDVDIKKAHNPFRNQYDGERILRNMSNIINRNRLFLIVVPYDLYVSNLNFVFGVALPWRGAVLSTYRLLWRADKILFKSRLEKTVKHELGHVFGLSHCENYCVMKFANSLYELDIKNSDFCESCKRYLLMLGIS